MDEEIDAKVQTQLEQKDEELEHLRAQNGELLFKL